MKSKDVVDAIFYKITHWTYKFFIDSDDDNKDRPCKMLNQN